MTLLLLLFAHLLADYPLQGEFLAKTKGKNLVILISHAGIWTGCVAVAGYLIGFDVTYLDLTLLFTIHAIADHLKATNKLWYKKLDPLKGGLLSDQAIHMGQLILFIYMN